jgi:hypothetical protein
MRRRAGLALIAGAVAAAVAGRARAAAPPGLIGACDWTMDDPLFGGMSAIHVEAGGARFLALSDRGAWTRGRLHRDGDGRIVAIEAAPMRRLLAHANQPLAPGRGDSEAVAVAADGSVYVAFEGRSAVRVLRYARIDGPAESLPVPPGFRRLQENAAIEALAIAADGTLFAVPERSGAGHLPFPVWRFRAGAWDQPFALPRSGPFLPVAADIGPDGRLYLLERAVFGLAGFASRLRRFRPEETAAVAETTLFETAPGAHGNLEGLSVWRDAGGGLVATMVADDNFQFFLPSEIVEYRLPG